MAEPIQYQPLTIEDFSGGFTDFYINAPTNRYKKAENLLILKTDEGKAKLISRPGSQLYSQTALQIPAGSQRIGTLTNFKDTVLVQSARKLYYISAGAYTTLQGPSGNDLFPTGTTTTNIVSYTTWNDHLFVTNDAFIRPQKIYKDSSAVLKLRTAGMPALASSPTVTVGGAGARNYIYAFVYYYTYQVGNRTFEDYGPVTNVSLLLSLEPSASNNAVTAIPVLANGTTHNYDTASANLKVKIYRTINNGTTFFFIGQVNNGTTVFTDNVSDATAQNGALLYTEGDVVDNDSPPLAKLIHITQDTAYYANIQSGSDIFLNRVQQSITGDPDSAPASFFCDVDDEIIGLSSIRGVPLVMGKNSVYRIDGTFDELGRGGMTAQKISDTASCVSSQSVVQTLEGVYWAGEDGFYACRDGYNVFKINDQWRKTYLLFTDSSTTKSRIQGKYDRKNRRIWWTVQEGSSSDCDKCYILDLNWPITSESAFTTAVNGDSWSPTALEFVGSNMLRGDSRGYLFSHDDGLFVDPLVNTSLTATSWATKTIIYDYVGPSTNFGTDFERKFVPRINVTCKNETNASIQIISNNDDNFRLADLKPIRYRGDITWGDPDVYWGTPDLSWNQEGLIEEWRRFPANNLRCSFKQIEITNAFVAILNSDLLGNCVVDILAKTATLVNAATLDWPDAVEYVIAFSSDSYVQEFTITSRSADVLTFSDVNNLAPSGTYSWVLRGYPKNEIIHLLSYTIHFAVMGKTQKTFTTNVTGEVGT